MDKAGATSDNKSLGLLIRQQLVEGATAVLETLLVALQDRFSALRDEAAPSREMQARRDASLLYERVKDGWRTATQAAWRAAVDPASKTALPTVNGAFELVDTEVVENRIIASRLALDLMEEAAQEINDLRRRLKLLNNDQELSAQDIAHPEALLLPLVEQWSASGLSLEAWQLVSGTVQSHLAEHLPAIYAQCNADLIERGVLPVIEVGPWSNSMINSAEPAKIEATQARRRADQADARTSGEGSGAAAPRRRAADRLGDDAPAAGAARGAPGGGAGYGYGYGGMALNGLRSRFSRAQGLIAQVGRLLGGSAAQAGAATAGYRAPSATLMAALEQQPMLGDVYYQQPLSMQPGTPVVLDRVASELRQQSTELKGQAQTDAEKAIIELVTLMFQSILQEERIPTGIRVWFARLQMPVLRVALAEPDFFNTLDHPARQLIDHMGSCVMGFDATGLSSAALETEIKRVVQVVEQYPDTGERVYRKVYEEFQAFLKNYLTEKPATQKVMGVAQQIEQKETLTIQYTIELRNQIKDMPVRDEVREFLFKEWAEVLAVAAVRHGAQHADTLKLKKAATDLIWAASSKPSRTDRARVIATLPDLLQVLRGGMDLLGLVRGVQEAHIKLISDTLADAFMAKTQAIDDAQIQALAARLAHLEDYVSDDDLEELPLDTQTIEDLLGIDASELDVVNSGGGEASAALLDWARQLPLGSWFQLDFSDQLVQVQYVWRSPLGHLHLFVSSAGRSYLIQTQRLGAYLQAGLLEPNEDEPLTMRATRSALGRLQSNPESLLA